MSDIASAIAFVIVALFVIAIAAMVIAGVLMVLLVPATLVMAGIAGIHKNPEKSS